MKRLSLLLFAVLLASCNSEEIPRPSCEGVTKKDAMILTFEYTNYTGQNPTVQILPDESDPRVLCAGGITYQPNVVGNEVEIIIPEIRLRDEESNYIAKCITLEEFDVTRPKNDQWFSQTEFQNDEDFVETNIAVVLCLDVSSSLGDDRENVKNYAKTFAEQLFQNSNNESYCSLVLFADTIISHTFTNNITDINNAISNFPYPDINAQTSTKLSEGILVGLNSLENTQLNVADRVLVVFTDGNDNGSNDPSLNLLNIKASPIQRYAIGLKGKGQEYNSNYLKDISDVFVEAENATELQKRFNDINELLANLYTIVYNRSNQTFTSGLDEPIKLRAIFFAEPYEIK